MLPADMPQPCCLCTYFMLPEDAQPATDYSVAIGDVCVDCKRHTEAAAGEIVVTKTSADGRLLGFTPWPLPDHEKRNNSAVINCTNLHQRKRKKS